jgi:uncharacterized protein (DUF2235 family)
MKFYAPGDDVYFFGFSRGAYTARFLAEMLDYVGLVTQGNEEMVRFAWKCFSQWQQRTDEPPGKNTPENVRKAREKKDQMFKYMKAFRETFTRPMRRLRFLGLFDTVNSVPRFEAAWMQRSKFPYTARSSAKVIRHAVGIDERRAKFRQDLISQEGREAALKKAAKKAGRGHHIHGQNHGDHHRPSRRRKSSSGEEGHRLRIPSLVTEEGTGADNRLYAFDDSIDRSRGLHAHHHEDFTQRYRSRSRNTRSVSRARSTGSPTRGGSEYLSAAEQSERAETDNSIRQSLEGTGEYDSDSDDDDEQDIEELWFPGGHADIGGGWDLGEGEHALSHTPLVWMVREARRAGLEFDEEKVRELGCWDDEEDQHRNEREADEARAPEPGVPQINIEVASPRSTGTSPTGAHRDFNEKEGGPLDAASGALLQAPHPRSGHFLPKHSNPFFHEKLMNSCQEGKIHDCLSFNNGLPAGSVISWKFMEYIPFRRMDLQPDGSWAPIRWPLPKGETRDIPDTVKIHHSVIRRMEADENYRPGNLIVGGGGRGVRKAPKERGMGDWVVVKEKGSLVGEVLMKRNYVEGLAEQEEESSGHSNGTYGTNGVGAQ